MICTPAVSLKPMVLAAAAVVPPILTPVPPLAASTRMPT